MELHHISSQERFHPKSTVFEVELRQPNDKDTNILLRSSIPSYDCPYWSLHCSDVPTAVVLSFIISRSQALALPILVFVVEVFLDIFDLAFMLYIDWCMSSR